MTTEDLTTEDFRRASDGRDFQIIKWWNECKNVAQVARKAGLSKGGIYRILDKYEVSRPKGSGRPRGAGSRFHGLSPKALPISTDRPLTVLNSKGKDILLDRLWDIHATDEMREARA